MRTASALLSFAAALVASILLFPCGAGATAAVSPGAHPSDTGVSPGAAAGPISSAAELVSHGSAHVEEALAPMKKPSGDIPDNQQFVSYSSPTGGYSLQVPEGWARRESGQGVRFDFNYDGLWLRITHVPPSSTLASMRADLLKKLESGGGAVTVKSVGTIRINGTEVLRATYDSNSEPNSVTNKRVRLENDVYYYYREGRIAELRLWAPLGADNVDQWQRVSRSFAWK